MPLKGYYQNELARVDKASKRLREVMDGLSPAFFIGMLTVDGAVTYANLTALESIGLELKDVMGKDFETTPWWSFSEHYRQQLRQAITDAAKGRISRFDVIFADKRGAYITIDFSLSPVFDVKKKVSYLVPSGHDVTERRAAERALTMLRVCNKSLLHAQNEVSLLNDICQLIVDVGGYHMVWVGYAQHDDAKTVKPMARAGIHKEMLTDSLITWAENDPRGQGIGGQCLRSGQTVVCEDVQKDSTISLYLRELAQEKGFRGGIALPLRNENKTFGMLVIFSNAIFKKGNDEIRLLQELADNLAFGIVNLRSQQERQLVLSAVHAIAEGVSASTGKEFFEKLALNMTEALGAQVGIISCLQEGEPLTSRTIVVVMDGKVVENFDIPITGTPCENLSHAEEVIEVIDVAKRYPFAKTLSALGAEAYIGRRIDSSLGQPLGQVFVLYRQPLDRTGFVSAVLKIFAARIAAELERQN